MMNHGTYDERRGQLEIIPVSTTWDFQSMKVVENIIHGPNHSQFFNLASPAYIFFKILVNSFGSMERCIRSSVIKLITSTNTV